MRLIKELNSIIKEAEDMDNGVAIYFNDLDEAAQILVMDKLKESLNVSEDDEYASRKITETLGREPLVTINLETLSRQLDFDFGGSFDNDENEKEL